MKDILDLCLLNLMEEHIADSTAHDADSTRQAIDIARKRIITKMEPSEVAEGAMDHHIAENTADDGTYPWIDSPQFRAIIEDTPTKEHSTMTKPAPPLRKRA